MKGISNANSGVANAIPQQEIEDIITDVFYPALPAPADVEAIDETISFDAVSGAEKYEVFANGNYIGEQLVTRSLRVSIDLTTLQGWNDLPSGTYDITVGATAEGYTRIIQSSAVSVTKKTIYNIYHDIINGWFNSGTDSRIEQGGIANIYFTPNEGYECPSSVTVINADYSYSSGGMGRIILSNPTGDVSVFIVCEQEQEEYFLTFSSPSPLTLNVSDNTKHWDGTLEYSPDKENWYEWEGTEVKSGPNNELYLRGIGNTIITGNNVIWWQLNGSDISCTGNIETLLDYQTVANGQHPTMGDSCYENMFNGCESLISAPELPATTLAASCYVQMFYGCTSLTTAPALPATTLATSCYGFMFNGCTSLTTAPSLPATTLAQSCYLGMFYNCTSLTTAPELPATTLASSCYTDMFSGCTSLTIAPELPATKLASSCYNGMFQSCSALTTAPELPATKLASSCYNGMFQSCSALTTAPELPATKLAKGCYANMFEGCSSLYVSDTQTAQAQYEWRIPTNDAMKTTYSQASMFTNCLGTRSSDDLAGEVGQQYVYYTQNPPVGNN